MNYESYHFKNSFQKIYNNIDDDYENPESFSGINFHHFLLFSNCI